MPRQRLAGATTVSVTSLGLVFPQGVVEVTRVAPSFYGLAKTAWRRGVVLAPVFRLPAVPSRLREGRLGMDRAVLAVETRPKTLVPSPVGPP